jgi:hypothetical protein
MLRRTLRAAYFVFLLETVQTALTGSDVYYWLIAGFGNAERLTHSHFGGIDAGFMTALISVIVQGYFCYRIWVLNNKRLSWMCWIIAVVCIPGYPPHSSSSDASLNDTVCAYSISCNDVVRCIEVSATVHFYGDLLSYTSFSRAIAGKYGVSKIAVYVSTLVPVEVAILISHIV